MTLAIYFWSHETAKLFHTPVGTENVIVVIGFNYSIYNYEYEINIQNIRYSI